MNIKIWDNHNQQWLEPMAIFFGKDNAICRVNACKEGDDPLSKGWYDLQGDDLKKIAIIGDINCNKELIPPSLLPIEEQWVCDKCIGGLNKSSFKKGTCVHCRKKIK